jgi:hypothetical protein
MGAGLAGFGREVVSSASARLDLHRFTVQALVLLGLLVLCHLRLGSLRCCPLRLFSLPHGFGLFSVSEASVLPDRECRCCHAVRRRLCAASPLLGCELLCLGVQMAEHLGSSGLRPLNLKIFKPSRRPSRT